MVATMFAISIHDLLGIGTVADARKVPYPENDRYVAFHDWGDEDFALAVRSVQEPGSILGFSGMLPESKVFALWNPSMTNEAVYVPWRTDGANWEQSLRDAGVDAVYVGPDSRPMMFAMSNRRIFQVVYEGELGGIYRYSGNDGSNR
jgi:hypothetical protein